MKTRISSIALAVAAEALTTVAIFVIIPDTVLSEKIRWLDFAVMTAIIAIYTVNVIFPFVDLADRSHKEAAGLGIRWAATGWYSALAFLFMAGNMIYAWQNGGEAFGFSLQAVVQGALLLFFLAGIVASRASMRKAQDVYADEETARRGKADVRASLSGLLGAAERRRELPRELLDRIRHASSESRYLTPSSAPGARDADRAIIDSCEAIESALADHSFNKRLIEDRLYRLENDIRQRRRL